MDSINKSFPTSKKRWNIKFEGNSHICKIYAETIEDAKKLFPYEKIEKITPFDDFRYVELIETIKKYSKFLGSHPMRGGSREIYMYPWGADCLIIRLYTDSEGGYFDFAEYQERGGSLMIPITFTYTNPTDIYEKYFANEINKNLPDGFISAKELKKTGAKLFSRKNGIKCWVDKDGYFYDCDNYDYPNKANKAEYKEFHDQPNAVFVHSEFGQYEKETKWWHSLDEFLTDFKIKADNTPSYCATPKYQVRRQGYKKLPPDERKVIYRYPYFNIDRQLDEGNPAEYIALMWIKMMKPKYFQDITAYERQVGNMVKYYQEYRSKNDGN